MLRTIETLSISCVLLALLSSFSGHFRAWAQSSGSTTGSIVGTVKDSQGAVLVQATIRARQVETNLERRAEVDSSGSYRLVQLPPGNYELTAEAEGFASEKARITLTIGRTALVEFTLPAGGSSEFIEVKAADMLDEGRTESSTNINRRRIDNLPINRRNFLDFSLTVARAVPDGLPQQGVVATSGLSFNGQPARFNNITIDGLDNNDIASGSVRSTFSQDAVREFQVVSDGYSAEFGRAIGGIVNIVTRGGGNEFHGSLFLLNRNDEISARDAFASFKPPYSQYQAGSALGGPIKKDKLFFFASFERLSIKQNNIVTISDETVESALRQGFMLRNGPVPLSVGTTTALARADGQLKPEDTFWVRYNFGGKYDGALEPFGGLTGETNAGIQRLDDNSIAVDNSYFSTRLNLVNETRFLYGRRNQDILPLEGGPQVRIAAPEGSVIFGRATQLPQFRQERLYQIVDNLTLTRGRQQLKFGVDYYYNNVPDRETNAPFFPGGFATFAPINFTALINSPNSVSLTGLQSFDPALRTPEQRAFLTVLAGLLPIVVRGFPEGVPLADLALPLAYAQGFGDSSLGVSAYLLGLFFQDDFKLRSNLLLKAGLRYDLNRVRFRPESNGNLSPRLALSYSPSRWPRLNLRAAYGLFFDAPITGVSLPAQLTSSGTLKIPVIPFPFSVLAFALPGHHFPESKQLPPSVTFIPQLSLSFPYQPNLRDSYTQQASLGFDYFISGDTAISVSYNFVRGLKLFGVRDINPIVRPNPTNPVLGAITGRIDPTRGDIFEIESSFDSYYHALTISINRRFSSRFGFLASYTYSKAIDNFFDVVLGDQPADPLRPGDERGLSPQDLRSRFVASGVWELSYTKNPLLRDFQLSTIVTLNSGRPYNLLAGVDLNMSGDNPPGDRPNSLGRNAGITPGFARFDLRLQRTVTIKERYHFQGIIEIFNLFNRANIDPNNIDRIFPPDAQRNFNLPPKRGGRYIVTPDRYRGAFAPRQFQLGFRVTF